MQFGLIPVALYLLLYAPGHYLLRGRRSDQLRASLLLREVVLSAACASWIGFVLAELGVYSLTAWLALTAAVAAVGRALIPAAPGRRYGSADAGGIALVLLTWAWVAPPLDTRLIGSDSSEYLASGVHLSRHGGLVIHDPTMPLLSPDMKRSLFPSVAADNGSPPYLRLIGSLVLRSLDSDEVLPAFHHLVTVWIAGCHDLAGASGGQWTITLFAGLSAWAIADFALAVGGTAVALMCAGLLLLLSPQYWYSRFLMPEIPAQFFLWGGLSCFASWCASRRAGDALVSGLAFGIAGLMRIENAAFLLLALVITGWCFRDAVDDGPPGTPGTEYVLLGIAGVLWLHAALHLSIFRTHYFGNLRVLSAEILSALSRGAPVLAAVAAGCVLLLLVARSAWPGGRTRRRVYYVLIAAGVTAGLWGDAVHGWPNILLLVHYAGIPTLLGGAFGLLLGGARNDFRLARRLVVSLAALVFVQVILQPHAAPVPFWTIRRSVTVLLPALCLGVALLTMWVARRWRRSFAVLLVALAAAGELPSLMQFRAAPFYANTLRHVRTIATLIPPGARLLYEAHPILSGLAPILWAERDAPAYFVDAKDTRRMKQLIAALGDGPIYWISTASEPGPSLDGVVTTPVALYEFLMTTPTFETVTATAAGEATTWDFGIAVYTLRLRD